MFFLTGFAGSVTWKPSDTSLQLSNDWQVGVLNAVSFIVGALASCFAGYIGMVVATIANGRVAMKCFQQTSMGPAFSLTVQGGLVIGFGLCTLGLAHLLVLVGFLSLFYSSCEYYNQCEMTTMYDALAAYGLGASAIAMFGRVGGGIFTKAADIAADHPDTTDETMTKDDKRNPAVMAEKVGDSVADVTGMTSDIFGSIAEGTCAAMLILASSHNCVYWTNGTMQATASNFATMCFPMAIIATGILVSFVTSLFATVTACSGVDKYKDVEPALKRQLLISTAIMTPLVFMLAGWLLPDSFFVAGQIGIGGSDGESTTANGAICEQVVWDATHDVPYAFGHFASSFIESVFDGSAGSTTRCLGLSGNADQEVTWYEAAFCVVGGLWSGLLIGRVTELYNSSKHANVRELARASVHGEASNVVSGLALGYWSVSIPVLLLTISAYIGFNLAQFFGVACSALGMLSTMATCLTIGAFGPISRNAGGIVSMLAMEGIDRDTREHIQEKLAEKIDVLVGAGDTTAAICNGYSIASAALVALALFGAYCTRAGIKAYEISVLSPMVLFGMFVGAMLPYLFSSLTIRSVQITADEITVQVRKQFNEIKGKQVRDGTLKPDMEWYEEPIKIATSKSLSEMLWPFLLVLLTPLLLGIFFGKFSLAGLIVGGVASGVQMALAGANSGGAWYDAKKYIETGQIEFDEAADEHTKMKLKKGTNAHDAAIIGDKVGNPLKDASGPAINILMKQVAIVALVFAPFVASIRDGYGLVGCTLAAECSA